MFTRSFNFSLTILFCVTLIVFVLLLCFDFGPVNKYKLEKVVILSRHNLRTPLSKNLKKITPLDWPQWKEKPGYLTEKGFLLEGYMGSFFKRWLVNHGVIPADTCPNSNEFFAYSNNVQRTMSSAKSFVSNAFPNCDIVINHTNGSIDPIFSPYIHNTTDIFRKMAINEMESVLKLLDINTSYERMEDLLEYQASDLCKIENKCNMTGDENSINVTAGSKPKLTGPLKLCNEALDAFFMEYYSGFPLDKVAWGKLVHMNDWLDILPLTAGYHNVVFNTSIVAKDIAMPLIKYMTNLFVSDNPTVSLLMAHDANINVLLNAMHFKQYHLDNEFVPTPIGGKIVFQKWYDTTSKEYLLKIQYVYQSKEQLRNATELSEESPPQFKLMELQECRVDENGFCYWDDFISFLQSIDSLKHDRGVHI